MNRVLNITIGNFYSPYQACGDDMKAWFDAYKNDSEKIIGVGGKVYSKIIHRCEFYIYDDFTMLVAIPHIQVLMLFAS